MSASVTFEISYVIYRGGVYLPLTHRTTMIIPNESADILARLTSGPPREVVEVPIHQGDIEAALSLWHEDGVVHIGGEYAYLAYRPAQNLILTCLGADLAGTRTVEHDEYGKARFSASLRA